MEPAELPDVPTNGELAQRLREAADLLSSQAASAYRVLAFRRAADTVERTTESLEHMLARGGTLALVSLPGVGGSIAAALAEMIHTGRWAQLERLRGAVVPEKLFRTIPGIGPGLARRFHDELHVDTLADLEAAAHDGRLARMRGIGPRRLATLRATLATRLSRMRVGTAPSRRAPLPEPTVRELLSVDDEYRKRVADGTLARIAPKRFNPEGRAWLPILHTERGRWHFTALFSNTARAHELDKTNDWVVLYFANGDHQERQRTVVTETHGPNAGLRVVRGREDESRRAEVA